MLSGGQFCSREVCISLSSIRRRFPCSGMAAVCTMGLKTCPEFSLQYSSAATTASFCRSGNVAVTYQSSCFHSTDVLHRNAWLKTGGLEITKLKITQHLVHGSEERRLEWGLVSCAGDTMVQYCWRCCTVSETVQTVQSVAAATNRWSETCSCCL